MVAEKVKKCIFDIFDENGIFIDSHEMEEDIDLTEYLIDSLQYIGLIVELEERLGVELPDEIIIYDNFSSINGFANLVVKAFEKPNSMFEYDFIRMENDDDKLC